MSDTLRLIYPGGSLNLSDGVAYYAPIQRSLSSRQPGEISFQGAVRGTTKNGRALALRAIERALQYARGSAFLSRGLSLELIRGGNTPVFFDVIRAEPLEHGRMYADGRTQEYTITLQCYPYARSAAVTIPVSGTLSGTTAAFFVDNVAGVLPALVHGELVDVSAAGVINLINWSVAPRDFTYAAAGDYVPWTNLVTAAGAVNVTGDATAVGSDYAQRATATGTAMLDLGRATLPTGDKYRGLFDILGRVFGTGTVIGTPSTPTLTPTAPTVADTTVSSNPRTVSKPQAVTRTTTSTTTFTFNWVQATTADSWLFMLVYRDAAITGSWGPPTGQGWVSTGTLTGMTDATETEILAELFYLKGASSRSSELWTVPSGAGTKTMIGFELTNLATPTNPGTYDIAGASVTYTNARLNTTKKGTSGTLTGQEIDVTATTVDEGGTTIGYAPEISGAYLVACILNHYLGSVDLSVEDWFGGFVSLHESGDVSIAGGNVPKGVTARVQGYDGNRATTTPHSRYMAVLLTLARATDATTTTTYQEPTPGELPDGTYTVRVQARDAAGYVGNASASSAPTAVVEGSSLLVQWPAVTDAVSYVVTIQHDTDYYETETSDVSLTLTTLEGLGTATGLPATTGAVAPLPFFKARVGMTGDYILTDAGDEVPVPVSGSWQLPVLGARVQLPPVGSMLDGDWTDSIVDVQGRSANGRSADIRADAIWVVPHAEPQMTMWAYGYNQGTKRRWVFEAHRSGRDMLAWLEDTGTGAKVGRVLYTGVPLLPPGDNIILLTFQQGSRAHVLAAGMTLLLTYYPRWPWEGAI